MISQWLLGRKEKHHPRSFQVTKSDYCFWIHIDSTVVFILVWDCPKIFSVDIFADAK